MITTQENPHIEFRDPARRSCLDFLGSMFHMTCRAGWLSGLPLLVYGSQCVISRDLVIIHELLEQGMCANRDVLVWIRT